jgi:predicted lipoprotein with Yx(FWY)xxD motif
MLSIRRALVAGGICVLAFALAACGSSSSTNSASTSSGTGAAAGSTNSATALAIVDETMNPGLHRTILVNAHGFSLYFLKGETSRHLLCTSAQCLKFWPPVYLPSGVTTPTVGKSISMAKLGTVMRPGGKLQVTYAGWPLYTFAGDAKPGQVKGNNFRFDAAHLWSVIEGPAPSSSGGSSSGGSSSSGGGWS